MVFDYYHRLGKADKRIYEASDALTSTRIPDASRCARFLLAIRDALGAENQAQTTADTNALVAELCRQLETPAPKIKVLSKRPGEDWGELHGLYEPRDDYRPVGVITVWMRTAQRKQVVAPRSFLRTVIHELCHHLDYEYYGLDESFHTEGFYKRESSIYRQLAKDVDIPSAARAQNMPSDAPQPELSDAERMRRKRVVKDGPFPASLKKKIHRRYGRD